MLKKEDVLINFCAHLEANTEKDKELKKILSEALSWDILLKKVKEEYMGPLVYKTVSRIEEAEKIISEDALSSLRGFYYSTLRKNLLVFKDLEKLLTCFNNENIKTIVFKGPMLAEVVYRDIGLRPMCDVDILVRKQDLQRTDKMLRELGYDRPFCIKDFSKIYPNPYRNTIMYKNQNTGPMFVHLYWHIINLYPYNIDVFKSIDMDKIWKDALPLTLANASTNTFSIYHQIIYLCLHAFNHAFAHLVHLCDINEFLRLNRDLIDWQRLPKEAALFGLSKYVYYGLYLCKKILGAEIPDFVIEQLKPRRLSLFERRFISSALERKPVSYSEILACFGMNESLLERMRFLKGILFPPRDLFPLIKQRNLLKMVKKVGTATMFLEK